MDTSDLKSFSIGAAVVGLPLVALLALSGTQVATSQPDAGAVACVPDAGAPVELQDTQGRRVVATSDGCGVVTYDVRSPHDSTVTIWLRTFPADRPVDSVLATIGRDQWRDEHDAAPDNGADGKVEP